MQARAAIAPLLVKCRWIEAIPGDILRALLQVKLIIVS